MPLPRFEGLNIDLQGYRFTDKAIQSGTALFLRSNWSILKSGSTNYVTGYTNTVKQREKVNQ